MDTEDLKKWGLGSIDALRERRNAWIKRGGWSVELAATVGKRASAMGAGSSKGLLGSVLNMFERVGDMTMNAGQRVYDRRGLFGSVGSGAASVAGGVLEGVGGMGMRAGKFAIRHPAMTVGTMAGVGAYMGWRAGGPPVHAFSYGEDLFLGNPHATHFLGEDITSRALNTAIVNNMSQQQSNEMQGDLYGTVNIGGAENNMDNYLASLVDYRNRDTQRTGPNGSLVLGLWNRRLNYV